MSSSLEQETEAVTRKGKQRNKHGSFGQQRRPEKTEEGVETTWQRRGRRGHKKQQSTSGSQVCFLFLVLVVSFYCPPVRLLIIRFVICLPSSRAGARVTVRLLEKGQRTRPAREEETGTAAEMT